MKQIFTQKLGRNVLLRGFRFLAVVMFLSFVSTEASAQCDNTLNFGQWGSATAPTSGSATFSTCNYYGEYSPLNGVAANTIYTCQIAAGGYVTVYQGTANGTLIANGTSPLSWTSTVAGTYYVHWNSDAACGTAFACQVTSVTYVGPGSGCTNPVAAGTVNAPTMACSGQPFNVALTGASTGTGLTYNWYSSTNGTTFSSVGTNASLSASQTVATYYFCEVICSGGTPDYTDTVFVDMNPFYNCYCASSAGISGDTKIQEFEISSTSTSSTASVCETYTDYTSLTPATVFQGNTYPARVQVGDCTPGTVFGATAYVWIDYDHSGSFDASEQTIVGAYATNGIPLYTDLMANITIPATSLIGNTGMRVMLVEGGVANACATYSYGETEDYIVNIQAPPANDVGIAEIVSPSFPACSFDSTVCVILSNLGTDTLFSATVAYALNSATPTIFNWTGMIPPNGQDTACVTVGAINITAGDTLTVYGFASNGSTTEQVTLNDTMVIADMNLALQGTYAIPTDYPSFNDAVDAMIDYGICADVVFEAANGTYNEQIVIPAILGSGPNATVTFTSASGDSSLVILQDSSTTAADNYVVRLDGADYFRFNNMTVYNTGADYSHVFEFQSQSEHNMISNSVIKAAPMTTGTFFQNNRTLIFSQTPSSNDNYSEFRNNLFEGGESGMWFWGTSTASPEIGLVVENNEFVNQYRAGAILIYNEGAKVKGNMVHSNSNYTGTSYGLDFEYCNFLEAENNFIYSDSNDFPRFGISNFYSAGTLGTPNRIVNNTVTIGSDQGPGFSELSAGYFINNVSTYVLNNTFTVRGGSATSSGLNVQGPSGLIIENNLVSNLDGGRALRTFGSMLVDFDYNNYYTSDSVGNVIEYVGQQFSSVAAFNAAFPQHENNGFSVDPEFNDTLQGRICSDVLDGQANPYAWITSDRVGASKTAVSDIGALEYFAPENFSLIGDTVCGSEYLVDLNGPLTSVVWDVNGVQSTGQSVLLTTGTTPTNNTVSVSFSSVCSTTPVTNTADFRLIPDVQLDSELHLCADDEVTLTPGGGASATYVWYPTNETTPTIDIDGGGVFSVTKNEEGCESFASTVVTQSDGVDLLDAQVCADNLPYTADATIVGGTSYAWSDGVTTTANIDLSTTGVYYVTATDDEGCTSIDSINFEAIDVPVADAAELSHQGLTFYFTSAGSSNAGSGAVYTWTFGDGSAPSNDPNPVHVFPWTNPSSPTTFQVTLTITNECGSNTTSLELTPDVVGVNELGNDVSYTVYPNPSNGVFNVAFEGNASGKASLRVLDIAGREISTSTANTNTVHTMNLSSVASGTYILEVNLDGVVSQSRISIN